MSTHKTYHSHPSAATTTDMDSQISHKATIYQGVSSPELVEASTNKLNVNSHKPSSSCIDNPFETDSGSESDSVSNLKHGLEDSCRSSYDTSEAGLPSALEIEEARKSWESKLRHLSLKGPSEKWREFHETYVHYVQLVKESQKHTCNSGHASCGHRYNIFVCPDCCPCAIEACTVEGTYLFDAYHYKLDLPEPCQCVCRKWTGTLSEKHRLSRGGKVVPGYENRSKTKATWYDKVIARLIKGRAAKQSDLTAKAVKRKIVSIKSKLSSSKQIDDHDKGFDCLSYRIDVLQGREMRRCFRLKSNIIKGIKDTDESAKELLIEENEIDDHRHHRCCLVPDPNEPSETAQNEQNSQKLDHDSKADAKERAELAKFSEQWKLDNGPKGDPLSERELEGLRVSWEIQLAFLGKKSSDIAWKSFHDTYMEYVKAKFHPPGQICTGGHQTCQHANDMFVCPDCCRCAIVGTLDGLFGRWSSLPHAEPGIPGPCDCICNQWHDIRSMYWRAWRGLEPHPQASQKEKARSAFNWALSYEFEKGELADWKGMLDQAEGVLTPRDIAQERRQFEKAIDIRPASKLPDDSLWQTISVNEYTKFGAAAKSVEFSVEVIKVLPFLPLIPLIPFFLIRNKMWPRDPEDHTDASRYPWWRDLVLEGKEKRKIGRTQIEKTTMEGNDQDREKEKCMV